MSRQKPSKPLTGGELLAATLRVFTERDRREWELTTTTWAPIPGQPSDTLPSELLEQLEAVAKEAPDYGVDPRPIEMMVADFRNGAPYSPHEAAALEALRELTERKK